MLETATCLPVQVVDSEIGRRAVVAALKAAGKKKPISLFVKRALSTVYCPCVG